jgi:hypothetical protein
MKLMITTRKHSYLIDEKDLLTVELGSSVFSPEENKLYMVLNPGELTEICSEVLSVDSAEALAEAIAEGGDITITQNIDAPTGFAVTADTNITVCGTISVSEDTEGNGVFMVTEGTLTLDGDGIVNGLGNNDWNMALWAKDNGRIVINGGHYTNVGASSETGSEHFDLVYASGNAQIEINGGEFECETPKWTLNIKDKDRATASIVVKGGKFHGFDPSNCEVEGPNTNFVAPGYKVVEEDGVYTVIAE